MELKKIQYFLRIVDQGSLSKAAQSLYLTQPTLSRFLDKLEDEVGVKLFIRTKSSALELTEAGKTYLETARQIDALWQALDKSLSPSRRRAQNRIHFGVYGDHLRAFASQCAKAVKQAYPDVAITFVCDNSLEIQRLTAAGELNLSLTAYESQDPRLTYIPCGKNEMNLVVSKDHPLAAHSYLLPGQEAHRLSLHQLEKDAPFALMRERTVLREAVQHYLQQEKYTPNIKQTYMRHGTITGVLTDDPSLIGFCPDNNISQKLSYIALDPPFYYHYGICYPSDTQFAPAEKLLIKLLKKQPPLRDLD